MPARATKRKNFLGFGKKTSTARLYKGYTIRGDGKTFTVDGDTFATMHRAQQHVDKIVRDQKRAKIREAAEERAEKRRARLEEARDRAAGRKKHQSRADTRDTNSFGHLPGNGPSPPSTLRSSMTSDKRNDLSTR
jgi:hypothetical protein